MSRDSKTGAATPYSLYKMYKAQGAVQANPYALRQQFGMQTLREKLPHGGNPARAQPISLGMQSIGSRSTMGYASRETQQKRSDSPPRMQFRVIQASNPSSGPQSVANISFSLASLSMRGEYK